MRPGPLVLIAVQILIIFLADVLGAIPTLPASLSQFDRALLMFHSSEPGHLEPPENLARRLYRFSYLEGDPEQPFAVHLQLQSQAFYRMMLQHYLEEKVSELDRVFSVVVPQTSVVQEQDAGPNSLLFAEKAYHTYDELTAEFWRQRSSIFLEDLFRRKAAGQREAEKFGDFNSKYSELPPDRKQALSARIREPREAFKHHLELVFRQAAPSLLEEFDRIKAGQTDIVRKLSHFRASSSGRD